jgi:hypothetical protein
VVALAAGAVAQEGTSPAPPEGLDVFEREADRGLRVTLTWNHRPRCAGYRVYRAAEAEGPYEPVGSISADTMEAFPFFLDDGVEAGATYYYRVSSLDAATIEGPPGSTVEAKVEEARRGAGPGKSIVVSLADQRAYFLENDVIVNILRCSTGAGGTPTGSYRILAHRGWVSGCAYWMDWRPNYGMHAWPSYLGAYEENLGVTPRSHGCVRLHPLEAYWPYNWAPDGTPFTVIAGSYGRMPIKGASCSTGAGAPSKTWYFPEGYVDAEFEEYLLLFNPGTEAVVARAVYYPEGHESVREDYHLPPGIRRTVPVNGVPGLPQSIGHSIHIEADGPLVAQQSEYFNMAGRRGGHSVTGADSLSRSWYFAEGYTGAYFSTYLLLFNPGERAAKVHATYYVAGAPSFFHDFTMPPASRGTTLVNALPDMLGKEVAVRVDSSEPLAAERTVYFDWTGNPNYVNGGDASMGIAAPSKTWYLAEGCTGHFFDEYLLVLNPGAEAAAVAMEFCTPAGPLVHRFVMAPFSRGTVAVDSLPGLESAEAGVIVTSDREIVVERSMYTTRDSRRGGHVSSGVPEPGRDWYFAEGYTGGTFDEYLLVMNPGDEPASVNFLFHTEGGQSVGAAFPVGPKTRFTLHVDDIPGLEWTGSAAEIHSDRPVAVEQTHYFCIPR